MDYDVVIAGAGPTGAVLAALLGQSGWRVLVLERDAEVFPLPRAVHMDHEILRVLQQLNIEERLPMFTGAVDDYLFQNASGENLVEIRGGGQLAVSGYSASAMFFQPELEACLRAHLSGLTKVEFCAGATLVTIEAVADANLAGSQFVRVGYDLGGHPCAVTARFLIGCDGASSTVRRLLDIDLLDLGFDEPWVVVDTLVHGDIGLPEDTAFQFCDPARPTTCVPAGPGRRRWEFMLLPGETREQMAEPARIRELLAPWGGPDTLELVRIAVYRFHAVLARQWRVGPVLLAGDAAHQTPPFMGQGLCSGVRDAANLAWKLDRVLSGCSTERLLDSYQVEREPHVRHVVETSIAMGRIVCELDPARAAVRDERLLAARAAGDKGLGGPRGGQVAPLVAGVRRPHDPAAGWLFPQPFVETGTGTHRLDDVTGCGFRLVVAGSHSCAADERLAARLERLGAGLVRLSALPVPAAQPTADRKPGEASTEDAVTPIWIESSAPSALGWLASHGLHAVVVRPDHYVFGGAADADSLDLLIGQLEQALV